MELLNHFVQSLLRTDEIFAVYTNRAALTSIAAPVASLLGRTSMSKKFGINITLPETTAKAPKNGWLEYYLPIGEAYFQVLC